LALREYGAGFLIEVQYVGIVRYEYGMLLANLIVAPSHVDRVDHRGRVGSGQVRSSGAQASGQLRKLWDRRAVQHKVSRSLAKHTDAAAKRLSRPREICRSGPASPRD
jgi:hypothetical protein